MNGSEGCDCVTDIGTFTSTLARESFKINHQLNCDGDASPKMSEKIYWEHYG